MKNTRKAVWEDVREKHAIAPQKKTIACFHSLMHIFHEKKHVDVLGALFVSQKNWGIGARYRFFRDDHFFDT